MDRALRAELVHVGLDVEDRGAGNRVEAGEVESSSRTASRPPTTWPTAFKV
jgi:hypothetical protein